MIRSNRRETPNNLQGIGSLNDTTVLKLADAAVATVTITKYQRKKSKKPETVLFYNETKEGVGVLD